MEESKSQPTLHDEIEAIPAEGEANNKTPLPPIIPPVAAKIMTHPPPKKETCVCRPDQTPWWKSLIEIGAFVLGIVFACIYFGQWRVMNRQLGEMQSATYISCINAQIARSTLLEIQSGGTDSHNLALGSIEQAAAVTRAEAAQIKISAPVDQLPTFNNVPNRGQVVDVPFTIVNIGKTLAIRVHANVKAVIVDRTVDRSAEPDFKFAKEDLINNGTLDATDKPVIFPLYIYDQGDKRRVFSPKEAAEILNGVNKRMFAYSRITYLDIFGVRHWNQRCMIFPSTGKGYWHIPKCSAYNRTDTNEVITNAGVGPVPPEIPQNIACKNPEK